MMMMMIDVILIVVVSCCCCCCCCCVFDFVFRFGAKSCEQFLARHVIKPNEWVRLGTVEQWQSDRCCCRSRHFSFFFCFVAKIVNRSILLKGHGRLVILSLSLLLFYLFLFSSFPFLYKKVKICRNPTCTTAISLIN